MIAVLQLENGERGSGTLTCMTSRLSLRLVSQAGHFTGVWWTYLLPSSSQKACKQLVTQARVVSERRHLLMLQTSSPDSVMPNLCSKLR